MKKIFKKRGNSIDKGILFLSMVLTLLGIVAIADASAPLAERNFSDRFFFAKQQLLWAFVGISLLLIFTKIHYLFWERIATLLFFVVLASLVLVLIPGIGEKALGAKRWIFIGPLSIQPSEFLKLSLSAYIAKLASRGKKFWAFILPLLLCTFLIMLQPDLGTALLILGIAFTQFFISEIRLLHLILVALSGTFATIFLIAISPYRRLRFLTFLNETNDPLASSYHIRQILLAFGSGGLFGVGLGESRQKYLFLPETATDSIFAVVAEELGFLGASIVIFLFAYFIFRALNIVRFAPDKFSRVFSAGIVAWIGFQVFLNMGSMVALVPLTGVPLPFFSYGGSSLVALLAGCGILLNISKYARGKD